jgi:ubiquinone/menaquinone biosynthesis C-methylase UbiE
MLKMYHHHAHLSNSPELWEETWNSGSFHEALRFCDVDPLRPIFERYARPGMTMLEGGCGQGHYVAYYTESGVHVIGLDFARNALARLRAHDPHLTLCAGDVTALPFRDASFDLYYSGGVVEHFEGGADAALREARRVLKPGGVLLISVPYLSPLRRALSAFRKDWRACSVTEADERNDLSRIQFWQYAYTPREFKDLLASFDFRVVETQGYSILWGLQEAPGLGRFLNARHQNHLNGHHPSSNGRATDSANGHHSSPSLLKKLVVSEDVRVPVAGLLVRALRWSCANMMMYVCAREDS